MGEEQFQWDKGSVHPNNKKRNRFLTPCGVYFQAMHIFFCQAFQMSSIEKYQISKTLFTVKSVDYFEFDHHQ